VLWELVCNDIKSIWKMSRVLQSNNDVVVLAEPFVVSTDLVSICMYFIPCIVGATYNIQV